FPSSLRFTLVTPATTSMYTLSLHDALPIYAVQTGSELHGDREVWIGTRVGHAILAARRLAALGRHPDEGRHGLRGPRDVHRGLEDRKSTRLNSSHQIISYAVFCLKKKNLQK